MRVAEADAFLDHGVVRVSTLASASVGTPSIGDIQATMTGRWQDSLTFAAPSEIPSLPGVSIIPGVTPGTAELVVLITGTLAGANGPAGYFRSSYSAQMSYGPGGSSGFAGLDGERSEFPPFDGTPLPAVLKLPVSFTYSEAFDVRFSLSARSTIGWEGIADGNFLASAFLNESAVWGGVENVTAIVPASGEGTTTVPVPSGEWSLNSPSFDYTDPVTVPEPSAFALTALGVACLLRRDARRLCTHEGA